MIRQRHGAGRVVFSLLSWALLAASGQQPAAGSHPATAEPPAHSAALSTQTQHRVDALLGRMSLEQKLGQLFLISVVGKTEPNARSREVLRQVPVGGIILFAYNLRGKPEQIARLNASLQSIAADSGAGVPYLIAVDQEGGRVQRLKRGFSALPAPRRMGQLDQDSLFALSAGVAEQLLSVGVNFNLAPVVEASAGDQDVIGDRGFAADVDHAAPKAAAFIKGTQSVGVLATAKHFPGNAGSAVDPHKAMPRIELSQAQIEQRLLPPFVAAFAAGVDAVMLSHVEIPVLDPERPVALSPQVVQGLLRGRLAYDGLVCSDDLLMGAVTQKFDPAEAAILAVLAGTDLLMVSNPAEVPRLHRALVQAVRSGRIPGELVDQAARRLIATKLRRKLWDSAQRLRDGASLTRLPAARRTVERQLKKIIREPTKTKR